MEMLTREGRMGSLGTSHYSSDEDSNSPQWITAQVNVDSKYQSVTEKGIRRLCSQLLDIKTTSAEELNSNVYSNYSAFVRISKEVLDLERELIELKNHISTQGNLVRDLTKDVYLEDLLNETQSNVAPDPGKLETCPSFSESNFDEDSSLSELENHTNSLSEVLDVLLAEHKIDEALAFLDTEEKAFIQFQKTGNFSSSALLSYQSALTERKARLAEQFVEVAEQQTVGVCELQKALSGLLRLGDGPCAHSLLLSSHHLRLQNSIQSFLPSTPFYSEAYTTTLAKLVFSVISQAAKDSVAIFGEAPEYASELVLWAQKETSQYVHLANKYLSISEAGDGGLRAATVWVQAAVGHCSLLETQGLTLCPYLIELIQPYVEGVLEAKLKQIEESVHAFAENDDWLFTSPATKLSMDQRAQLPIAAGLSDHLRLTSSAYKFVSMVQDIADDMTPLASMHFGGSILEGLARLFDNYINTLVRAIPCPSEDENSIECRDNCKLFWAETQAQQLALLGNASALADELLPLSVSKISEQLEKDPWDGVPETPEMVSSHSIELKDWKRHLQRAVDRLRDHFCQQYVLGLIYSKEGNLQLTGNTYINGRTEDLFWDPDPMPSSSFQALFTKLNQLEQVAADVLVGRDKVVKHLLMRLTETVVIWLSNDQEFWEVIEDDSATLRPFGLQQLILDMHFIIQIAVSGHYSSRHVHQSVLAIIKRAINVFSARGIDPNSALPGDEWFVDTAGDAIAKLPTERSQGNPEAKPVKVSDGELDTEPGGEPDRRDDENSNLETIGNPEKLFHQEADVIPDSPTSLVSADSFASAEMGGDESAEYDTGPEA